MRRPTTHSLRDWTHSPDSKVCRLNQVR